MKLFILFVLATLTLHSCNGCYKRAAEKYGGNEVELREKRAAWSKLDDVGFPEISDTIPSIILERYCYTASYNKITRQPNWVMWQLTDEHVLKKPKDFFNDYQEDTDLPIEIRSTLDDYASSDYDRGHMCPGGDCNWDYKGRDETYYLSNMCPQNPNLNRGDWKEIEMACRKWAKQYGCVYVVCGPLFLKSQVHEKIGKNEMPVPEAFFKVVLCVEPNQLKGIGFICRNTDGNKKKDFYVNTIRQVERITGYGFFPKLEDSIKNAVYDIDNINVW